MPGREASGVTSCLGGRIPSSNTSLPAPPGHNPQPQAPKQGRGEELTLTYCGLIRRDLFGMSHHLIGFLIGSALERTEHII